MSRSYISFVFAFLHFVVISSSQSITEDFVLRKNSSLNRRPELDAVEAQESDLWLLSPNDPVPAQLNRLLTEGSLHSNVRVSSFRNYNYDQFRQKEVANSDPVRSTERNDNGDRFLVYEPDLYNVRASPSRRHNAVSNGNGFQGLDGLLVALPLGYATGFWEAAQPQLIDELRLTGRQVSSSGVETDFKFDPLTTANGEQINFDVLPDSKLKNRIPLEIRPENYNESIQSLRADTNNSTLKQLPILASTIVWTPYEEKEAYESDIKPNNDRLLYEIAFDDVSPNPLEESNIQLTSEDIELLQKLGILSSLNFEVMSVNNTTGSSSVGNVSDSINIISSNASEQLKVTNFEEQNVNLSTVEVIEVPDFTLSPYNGNIPDISESKTRNRPIPYALSEPFTVSSVDSILLSPLEQDKNVSMDNSQIQEILQLLGLSMINPNKSSLEKLDNSSVSAIETNSSTTTNNQTLSFEQNETLIKDSNQAASNVSKLNDTSSVSAENLQPSSTRNIEIEVNRNKTSIRRVEPGLVSSGRIQPRLLESTSPDQLKYENEIIEFFSGNVTPLSLRKLELLRKLRFDPKSYVFGFAQNDGNGTFQHRNETSNSSGVVQGSYGYRDPAGVYRNVNYIADDKGFHAVVRTNEPGVISHSVADAVVMHESTPAKTLAQMLVYSKRDSK